MDNREKPLQVSIPKDAFSDAKAVRIGISCGFFLQSGGQVFFSERFLQLLCEEAEKVATLRIELFFKDGWSEVLIPAALQAKDPAVIVTIDELEGFLFKSLAMPFTEYLSHVAEKSHLLILEGDGPIHADKDFESELFEMCYSLVEKPEDVRSFLVRAYIQLANARLLLYDPERVNHCHLLGLFLFLVFKELHVPAIESVLASCKPSIPKRIKAKENTA